MDAPWNTLWFKLKPNICSLPPSSYLPWLQFEVVSSPRELPLLPMLAKTGDKHLTQLTTGIKRDSNIQSSSLGFLYQLAGVLQGFRLKWFATKRKATPPLVRWRHSTLCLPPYILTQTSKLSEATIGGGWRGGDTGLLTEEMVPFFQCLWPHEHWRGVSKNKKWDHRLKNIEIHYLYISI